jgi:argininosuccinate lyase
MTRKPWEHAKSSGSEHNELAARFVESLSYDTRLYRHDIAGSIAHARMLQEVGLITADELAAIEGGLGEIQQEIEAAGVTDWSGWEVELEDVHMCIEAALIAKIGEAGRKLHTGRSRNDQVATDLAMWTAEATSQVKSQLVDLISAFYELAERDGRIVMPSYTHLQRAQPIVLGGELVAWADAFGKCVNRLDALFILNDEMALGSGAIAGSSLPLDRRQTLRRLPLDSMSISAIASTASRDVAIDFVYALAMAAMWLSRWAEQWIIYMTSEFGFLAIGDDYTTGSSMMPQKRNPDMLELIRGRCGDVYGRLVALLTMCKGLTVGYNRDLQEDKRHVFAAFDTVMDCVAMAGGIVRSACFDESRIREKLDRGFLDATSLAEYLVTRGVPFRTAHQHVGSLVHHCIDEGIDQLAALSVDQMKQVSGCQAFDSDVFDWLGPDNVVTRYRTAGNAGLSGFEQRMRAWQAAHREER